MVAESFGMEPASVVEVAADNSYGVLTDHNGVDHTHIKGDKENDECSNRGIVSSTFALVQSCFLLLRSCS